MCENSIQRYEEIDGAICISRSEDFGSRHMTIEELVEPLDAFVSGDFNTVISDPSHKFVEVDQVYKNKDTLKAVMDNYAIAKRFQFKTKRSNSISYTLVCVSDDCDWLMKASDINKSGMLRIRSFRNEHTCPLKDKVFHRGKQQAIWLGGLLS